MRGEDGLDLQTTNHLLQFRIRRRQPPQITHDGGEYDSSIACGDSARMRLWQHPRPM